MKCSHADLGHKGVRHKGTTQVEPRIGRRQVDNHANISLSAVLSMQRKRKAKAIQIDFCDGRKDA